MDSILLYLLIFSDYTIGKLCIADYALILLIVRACIKYPSIPLKKEYGVGISLLLVGVSLSTVLNIGKEYFNLVSCILSVGKLMIYLFGISVVPRYIISKGIDVGRIVKNALIISVLGAFSQYAIVLVLGRGSWPLYGLGGNFFGLVSENSMFSYSGMMRPRGFWSEPAHYALTISMLFILVLFIEKNRTSKLIHITYILGMVMANSISGYGIMVAIYAIYLLNFKSANQFMATIFLGIILMTGLIILIITNDYLRSRLIGFMTLKDSSGVVRTIGGFHFLSEIPWYGVGVSNNANFYHSLNGLNSLWYSGSGEFYNNILLAIITMGYVGAVGFLLYEYGVLRKNKKIFFALLVTHFGWGKLFTAPIWIFLIYYLIMEGQATEKNQKHPQKHMSVAVCRGSS
ncbi:MAG: hypothetical protein HFH36_12850 [Lachnospiraceae bacterium]|nr:hypothetical protein [Lachnospiraceae bacterium]